MIDHAPDRQVLDHEVNDITTPDILSHCVGTPVPSWIDDDLHIFRIFGQFPDTEMRIAVGGFQDTRDIVVILYNKDHNDLPPMAALLGSPAFIHKALRGILE